MTRRDTVLVALLLAVLGAVGVILVLPAAAPSFRLPTAATPEPVVERPYREGVLGRPVSASPLTARSQPDRDLVALVFSGLVRNGPDGTIEPDLAARWTTEDDGRTWVFELRRDAHWHDGEPVTAEDVAFTIRTLQAPDYTGPVAASWQAVTVRVRGPRTVAFILERPLGGFLQAATQPIAPAHLLEGVPVAELPDHPFGTAPVGSGPFELVSLEPDLAVLRPATAPAPDDPGPTPRETDSLATAPATARPDRAAPLLDGIELHFADDAADLVEAYRAGRLDAISGLEPATAVELAAERDTYLLRYPGSTLTAVLLDLRPSRPTFRSAEVRTALLAAIDRRALIDAAFAGAAALATSPIPPSSPLSDRATAEPVAHDPSAAAAGLEAAGWKRGDDGWRPPRASEPLAVELLSPDRASNPGAYEAARSVAADWRALGLAVVHRALPAAEFGPGHLATGDFTAAVADIAVGLDPDLYPLLASSQTLSGGANVTGLQDPRLDALLLAARESVGADRVTAYAALQERLATGRYVLPLAFRDEVVVVRGTVSGPVLRQVADPSDRFWDVLTWRLADDP